MVSHELPKVSFAIADDGVFLDAQTKTVIAHGSPSVLRETCSDPQVRAFMRREQAEHRRCRQRVNAMILDRQTAIGAFVFGGFILALGAVILFGNFRLFNPTVAGGGYLPGFGQRPVRWRSCDVSRGTGRRRGRHLATIRSADTGCLYPRDTPARA